MRELFNDPDVNESAGFPPILSFDELRESHPTMRPYVIEGYLRRGETANIIAAPKMGKSFLSGNIAWCIASGRPWLTANVQKGKVLIIDNELHRETLADRLRKIAMAMEVEPSDYSNLDIVSLRGQDIGIPELVNLKITPGQYELIIIDALYRAIPDGTNENENSAMMKLYNAVDQLAERWQSAIALVHHTSKGSQGDKAITDVGAGAGAISRAADTHIAIRPHELPELAVLQCVTRSSKEPEAMSVQFDWPLWRAVTEQPRVKKPGKDKGAEDRADMEKLMSVIPVGSRGIQQSELKDKVGFGIDKVKRLAVKLIDDGKLRRAIKNQKGKSRKLIFYVKCATESATASSTDDF